MPPSASEGAGRPNAAFFTAEAAAHYDGWFETAAGRYARRLEDELLREAVGDVRGRRVLDVGCGTGLHLRLFAEGGAAGVGLEPSGEMLQRARERLAGGAYLVRGRAEALPFRNGAFDVVTMITSLEFVADARAALAEASRVCRRRVVVAALNGLSLSAAWRKIKRNVKATLFRAVRFYEPRELRRALRPYAAGPVCVASTLHLFPIYHAGLDGALASLDRWLTRRGWLLGAFLVAAADVRRARI
ncbi:MAG TPA: class I SAM-dependent methyltransferase [bacterium]|nr:class I SAM-dependent methyltransferase [bacterium]